MSTDGIPPAVGADEHPGIPPLSETDPMIHARRWWILAVLCLSLVIVFVGNASLNVTIPTLSRDLHATESQLQWVVAIYSLVFAGLLFTSGALGDRYGRKGALQSGLVIFLIGTTIGALSNEIWQLIASRAVMGVGAAFIMPSTLSILVNVFNEEERVRAIAIWASLTGAAGIIGPVASGFLIGHFWYGSVFLVNVPIVLFALVVGWFIVPRSRDPEEAPLDPIGALLSIIGIVSLVYGLIEAPDKGWLSPTTLVSFGIAAVVIVAFVLWELHCNEPMLDMHYFRNPSFSTGTGGMILIFLALYGVFFLMTQYFQLVLGYSAFSAAVRFVPVALVILLLSPRTPALSDRFGARTVVAVGMGLVATSMAMIQLLGTDSSYWLAIAAILPLATGMALSMSPMTASIMSAVPDRRAGSGSATNDATRELGAALGVAILGSIATSQYRSSVAASLHHLPDAVDERAKTSLAGAAQAATQLPAGAARAVTNVTQQAFVDGLHTAALVGVVLALLAVASVLRFLPARLPQQGALRSPLASFEATAELFGGMIPELPDEMHREELARRARSDAHDGSGMPSPDGE
ncbi:MAG: DHA2 family efflux MFS transporter permease subunit [Acidimicrobiia bacterium]